MSANSIQTKILNDGVTLLSEHIAQEVVARKELIVLDEDVANLATGNPLFILAMNGRAVVHAAFENQAIVERTLRVAIVIAGNQKLETGMDILNGLIDTVTMALNVTSLPTATSGGDPCGVFDSDAKVNDDFDIEGLANNYDYTVVEITYRSAELRYEAA
jgi:hypothetical protein